MQGKRRICAVVAGVMIAALGCQTTVWAMSPPWPPSSWSEGETLLPLLVEGEVAVGQVRLALSVHERPQDGRSMPGNAHKLRAEYTLKNEQATPTEVRIALPFEVTVSPDGLRSESPQVRFTLDGTPLAQQFVLGPYQGEPPYVPPEVALARDWNAEAVAALLMHLRGGTLYQPRNFEMDTPYDCFRFSGTFQAYDQEQYRVDAAYHLPVIQGKSGRYLDPMNATSSNVVRLHDEPVFLMAIGDNMVKERGWFTVEVYRVQVDKEGRVTYEQTWEETLGFQSKREVLPQMSVREWLYQNPLLDTPDEPTERNIGRKELAGLYAVYMDGQLENGDDVMRPSLGNLREFQLFSAEEVRFALAPGEEKTLVYETPLLTGYAYQSAWLRKDTREDISLFYAAEDVLGRDAPTEITFQPDGLATKARIDEEAWMTLREGEATATFAGLPPRAWKASYSYGDELEQQGRMGLLAWIYLLFYALAHQPVFWVIVAVIALIVWSQKRTKKKE